MPQRTVERILRDVLDSQGVHVSMHRVEQVADGWRITVVDTAQRVLTTHVPDGPPAAIRAALIRWTDNTMEPL